MRAKNKLGVNEKTAWVLGFCIPKKKTNFGAFCYVFSSSISLLFLKSDDLTDDSFKMKFK